MAQLTLQQAIDTLNECTRVRRGKRIYWCKDKRVIAEGWHKNGETFVLFTEERITFTGQDSCAVWFTGVKKGHPKLIIDDEIDRPRQRLSLHEAACELGLDMPLQPV